MKKGFNCQTKEIDAMERQTDIFSIFADFYCSLHHVFCNGENLTFKRQQIIHGEITIYTFYTNIEIFVVKSKSHWDVSLFEEKLKRIRVVFKNYWDFNAANQIWRLMKLNQLYIEIRWPQIVTHVQYSVEKIIFYICGVNKIYHCKHNVKSKT